MTRSLLLCFCLAACAPAGANWLVADFNKSGKNYAPFPLQRIRIGQSENELVRVLGKDFRVVEASSDGTTLEWERWESVPGPDYVVERLLVRVVGGRAAQWRVITVQASQSVPLAW